MFFLVYINRDTQTRRLTHLIQPVRHDQHDILPTGRNANNHCTQFLNSFLKGILSCSARNTSLLLQVTSVYLKWDKDYVQYCYEPTPKIWTFYIIFCTLLEARTIVLTNLENTNLSADIKRRSRVYFCQRYSALNKNDFLTNGHIIMKRVIRKPILLLHLILCFIGEVWHERDSIK